MNKNEICFITARLKSDNMFDGLKKSNYDVLTPYKDINIFVRLVREFVFRLRLPFKKAFYNKKAILPDKKFIIVLDPLITKDYLLWLQKNNPNAKIILQYVNREDTTIRAKDVPEGIELWSYDKIDCETYNMKYYGPGYLSGYVFDGTKCEKEYDVVFVGRDKGRLKQILDIEKKMNDLGLRTFFYICADRWHLKFKNRHYKRLMSYDDYLDHVMKSKAILNVTRNDQEAITLRELECVFGSVKCVTTNNFIKKFDLYDSTRFFVLHDNYDELVGFLNEPIKKCTREELKKYDFDDLLESLLTVKTEMSN